MTGGLDEPQDKFRSPVRAYPGADMRYMRSRGVVSNVALFRNSGVAQPFADKFRNLNLPRGKMVALLNIIPLFRVKHGS
jgi:hypothetical protein